MIRLATSGDAEAIAKVHTHTWQFAYEGILSKDFLDGLQWETRVERWEKIIREPLSASNRVFVSTGIDGIVTGFASLGPVRDEDLKPEKFFELYAIYVAPEYWDLGVGRALCNAALDAVPSGSGGVSLWVLTQNERARRFYGRIGFMADGSLHVENIGGTDVEEMRSVHPGLLITARS